MTATVIAINFTTRKRVPTLQQPAYEIENDLIRHVRAICTARQLPTAEHPFVCSCALRRLRDGETLANIHAWARRFAAEVARACRNPTDAA